MGRALVETQIGSIVGREGAGGGSFVPYTGATSDVNLGSHGITTGGSVIFNGITGLGSNYEVHMTGGNGVANFITDDGGSCQLQFANNAGSGNLWSQGINPGYFGDERYFICYAQQTGRQCLMAAATTNYIGVHSSNPQEVLHIGEINGYTGAIRFEEGVNGFNATIGMSTDDGYLYARLDNTSVPRFAIGASNFYPDYTLHVDGGIKANGYFFADAASQDGYLGDYDGVNNLTYIRVNDSSSTIGANSASGYSFTGGDFTIYANLKLGTAGKGLYVKEGTDGKLGTATLVSGTKAITINGLGSTARAFVQLVTPGGTLGNGYKAVCTANTLTITSVTAAGATQTLDTSVLNYFIVQPA